jgi:hypothetical protein
VCRVRMEASAARRVGSIVSAMVVAALLGYLAIEHLSFRFVDAPGRSSLWGHGAWLATAFSLGLLFACLWPRVWFAWGPSLISVDAIVFVLAVVTDDVTMWPLAVAVRALWLGAAIMGSGFGGLLCWLVRWWRRRGPSSDRL